MIMVTDKYSLHLPEVHAHGDGKLLVIDGEDVQNLNVNIDIDGSIRDRGLELLVGDGKAPPKDTF